MHNRQPVQIDYLDTPNPIPVPQPTEYTPPHSRRNTASAKHWLLLLGGVLVFVGILGMALVGFLHELYQNEIWFRTLANTSLAMLIVTAVGLVGWCAFSVGLALHHRARRESLTTLPGNVPMPTWALSGATAEGLAREYLYIKLIEAQNSGMRNVTTLSPSQAIHYGAGVPAAHSLAERPLPQLAAVASAEWLDWIDRTPHVLLAAETGAGKSTTAKAILAPRIAAGESVFIIDPHSSEWLGLPSVGGGEDWNEVQQAMDAVFDEYQERLEERDAHRRRTGLELPVDHFSRLTVLLDEANTTRANIDTGSKKIANPWRRFVQVLGSGARKVRISIILLAQSGNVEDIGLSAAMRENFTRIALDSGAARKLVAQDEPDSARRALLYAALADRSYPAVCEYKGRVYLLDRTGLDKIGPPANPQAAAWKGRNDKDVLRVLLGKSSASVTTSDNDVPTNVPAAQRDVPTVPAVTITQHERAEIAFLLASYPASEVVKRLTGYHPRKYAEFRAKVDVVASELADTT